MALRDLQARRAKTVADMREINNSPADNGDLSTEQETRFSELAAELDKIDAQISRQERLDAAEKRSKVEADLAPEMRGYSLTRAIAAAAQLDRDNGIDAGREREVAREIETRSGQTFKGLAVPLSAIVPVETRAITTTAPAGGPGGAMVQTDVSADPIDLLRANTIAGDLGVSFLNGLTGNLSVPKLTQGASASWLAENADITSSTPEMGTVGLSPKTVGALVEMSRQMLLQTSGGVERLVRSDLAMLLGRALDRAILIGGGTDEPVGVLSTTGLTAQQTAAAALTEDDLIDAMAALETANSEATGVALNPAAAALSRKLRDEHGQSLNAISGVGRQATMQGLPARTSTQIPFTGAAGDTIALFGRWSDVMVGAWGSLDLVANPYGAGFARGAVEVRAMMSADVNVRHIESFVNLTVRA